MSSKYWGIDMCEGWSENQRKIYAGLKDLGGEAAGYFKSALNFYYDISQPNRVSYLAHAAREIDGGLRDIFSPETMKKRAEKRLNLEGLTKILGDEFKDYRGHIASIVVALDVDAPDDLAKEWWVVATKFNKYAHRSGIWKQARDFEEFRPFWDRYENVLLKLVGSYYAIVARLDRLINLEEIAYASVGALLNLLKQKPYEDYFFRKLNNLNWFQPLKENGYFSPERIKYDEQGNAIYWNVLDYLERVSAQAIHDAKFGKDLLEIINNVIYFSIKRKEETGQGINHYYIWSQCVKILDKLPASVIKDGLALDKFQTWLLVWTEHAPTNDLTISDIGENLLPKFLNDDYGPDYAYAEIIIKAITAIKAGGKQHAFTKREEAVLVWQSYWILKALQQNGQLIGKKCSVNLIFVVAENLRKVLAYKQKNHYVHLEVGDALYRVEVSRIMAGEIKFGQIEFKEDEYECIVKQFSKEQLQSIDRKNDFWALHNLEPAEEIGKFTFSALAKDNFKAEIRRNLPQNINWQEAEKYEEKLGSIYEGIFSDYSHIWCRSLQSGPEHVHDAEDVLTVVLRDVLSAKCEVSRQEGRKVLEAFLTSKYQFPIFRRFVLLCIDKFWDDYGILLDKLIKVLPTILEESDLEVEMQDVLKNHNMVFNPELKNKLKELIDNVPEYYVEKGDEKLSAYWKYKWLSPLCENSDFAALYEDAKQKAEPKGNKPYAVERSAFMGGVVIHKSPVTKEVILQMPIVELVKYLCDFKGPDSWHGNFDGEPDREGLADVLQAAVKDSPNKFSEGLEDLMKAGYFYLHRIFRGLNEAWNAGSDLDWQNIFDFIIEYLNRGKDIIIAEALQAQGEDSGSGRYIWIVEDVGELISSGSEKDDRAFPNDCFERVGQIFDLMIPLLKGESHPDTQRDALTYAFNTTLGRTIRSFMTFSLHEARITKKKQEKWGGRQYERFFRIGIDAQIYFGCYLPQMNYLDEEYTQDKIKFFSQKDSSDFEWQMFMEGYLRGARIYKDLYDSMRPSYEMAIENAVFKGHADERLVEHICIGYLQLGESLTPNNKDGKPSLFWKMLNEASTPEKRSRWEEVAGFFWSISGRRIKKEDQDEEEKPPKDFKNEVLAFWEWTVKEEAFVKERLGEEYLSFLSRMAELAIWLDKIDATTEKWVMLSAPHIGIEHRSAFFLEYLTKFEDEESIRRIGKILKKVLEGTTPTYNDENIKLLVARLYEIGKKDAEVKADADEICNTYGKRNVHFLRELYYQNQK